MSWLSAAVGAVTGIWGAHSAAQSVAANNEFQAAEAQKQRDWQEKMSSTAHQREVADLRKAGLNPILSANSGASTPSGAMPVTSAYTGQASDISSGLNAGTNWMNAKTSAKAQKAQEALFVEQMQNLQSQTRKTNAEAESARVAADAARVRTAIELSNMVGLGNYQRAQIDYLNGPLSMKTHAEVPLIEAETRLTNAQKFRIIRLTPLEAGKLSAEIGQIKAETQESYSRSQLNHINYLATQVSMGKMSQETAESIARQRNIDVDTLIKNINAKDAEMQLEKRKTASRYSGQEPQDLYDYLLRTSQNVGDIVGAVGSPLISSFFR